MGEMMEKQKPVFTREELEQAYHELQRSRDIDTYSDMGPRIALGVTTLVAGVVCIAATPASPVAPIAGAGLLAFSGTVGNDVATKYIRMPWTDRNYREGNLHRDADVCKWALEQREHAAEDERRAALAGASPTQADKFVP